MNEIRTIPFQSKELDLLELSMLNNEDNNTLVCKVYQRKNRC